MLILDCWNGEPDNRPTINQVIAKLKSMVMDKNFLPENNFSATVNAMLNLLDKVNNKNSKQEIFNYFDNHHVTLKETYNWLINNQNDSNSIFLLGRFKDLGIETRIDKQKAFELYQKAADLGNVSGINYLGHCFQRGTGTRIDNQKAFELYQKATNLGDSHGMNNLGNCYQCGTGTDIDKQKAFELYQKAAN